VLPSHRTDLFVVVISVVVWWSRSFRDSRYTYRDPLTAALIGVYALVFLLSIVGNALVVVVIRLDTTNRGVDAFLMLNLAVADLLGTPVRPSLTACCTACRPSLGQLSLSSFLGRQMSSKLESGVCCRLQVARSAIW